MKNRPLSNQLVKEEGKIKKNLEINENRNTTYQNLHDAAKAVLRKKHYSHKSLRYKGKERSQKNITLHVQEL